MKGKRYRVLKDRHFGDRIFKKGDIVVALDNTEVPFCILENEYIQGKDLDDYNFKQYWSISLKDLEEVKEMTNLETLIKQREELNAQIEALEKEALKGTYIIKKDWLSDNKCYYFIDRSYGEELINNSNYNGYFNKSIEEASIFKSKELATRVMKEQQLRRKMERFSEENGSANIYWNDENQTKYCIQLDTINNRIYIETWGCSKMPFQIYFNTLEVAQKALELFKKDLMDLFGGEQ